MTKARIGTLAIAVIALTTVALAQKADFSGTWTPDASAAPGRAARGSLSGPITVRQTADTLTVERGTGETRTVTTYKIDGTESRHSTMGRGGTPIDLVSTAKWNAGRLTITTKRPGQDGAIVETSETWSIAAGVLTIESTTARGTEKRVYKKNS